MRLLQLNNLRPGTGGSTDSSLPYL
jgi:hypothetical protein